MSLSMGINQALPPTNGEKMDQISPEVKQELSRSPLSDCLMREITAAMLL